MFGSIAIEAHTGAWYTVTIWCATTTESNFSESTTMWKDIKRHGKDSWLLNPDTEIIFYILNYWFSGNQLILKNKPPLRYKLTGLFTLHNMLKDFFKACYSEDAEKTSLKTEVSAANNTSTCLEGKKTQLLPLWTRVEGTETSHISLTILFSPCRICYCAGIAWDKTQERGKDNSPLLLLSSPGEAAHTKLAIIIHCRKMF